jgi:hypothetical protein
MDFKTEDIEKIHEALGLEMASKDDALPGATTRGEAWDRNAIKDSEGNYATLLYNGEQAYYEDNGELIEVETGYAKNHDQNMNDYILVEIEGEQVPIDWMLANLVKCLIANDIRTLGSDQGALPSDPNYDERSSDFGFISIMEEDRSKVNDLFANCKNGHTLILQERTRYTISVRDEKTNHQLDKTAELISNTGE